MNQPISILEILLMRLNDLLPFLEKKLQKETYQLNLRLLEVLYPKEYKQYIGE